MKLKLMISLFFVIFYAFNANCQGNLQFNKVVFFEKDTTVNLVAGPCIDSFAVSQIIVPAGKVLKVEGINRNDYVGSYYLLFNSLRIDGSYYPRSVIFPIWLNQGTYKIGFYHSYFGNANPCNNTVNGPNKLQYQFSAIEFNIIQ